MRFENTLKRRTNTPGVFRFPHMGVVMAAALVVAAAVSSCGQIEHRLGGAPPGASCNQDKDCAVGEFCCTKNGGGGCVGFGNVAVASGTCGSNLFAPGQCAYDGNCTLGNSCTFSGGSGICLANNIATSQNQNQPIGCAPVEEVACLDGDCPSGQTCVGGGGGVCLSDCSQDSDCGSPLLVCIEGRCNLKQCTFASDCGSGQGCFGGSCFFSCSQTSDCPSGQACVLASVCECEDPSSCSSGNPGACSPTGNSSSSGGGNGSSTSGSSSGATSSSTSGSSSGGTGSSTSSSSGGGIGSSTSGSSGGGPDSGPPPRFDAGFDTGSPRATGP